MKTYVAWLMLAAFPAYSANLCKSNAAGSWSAAGTWTNCGGGIPGTGDVASITHAVTVDVNTTVGASVAASPLTPPTLANSGGAGGTWNGTTGSYRAGYSWVNANGETTMSPETGNITLTNGSSNTRITVPALPTGVTSTNIYLTGAGTGSLTQTLYATGVVGTTYDPASASWNNGTQAQAAAPGPPIGYQATAAGTAFGGAAIRASAAVTVATGVTLTVRGDIVMSNVALTLSDDSGLTFDPSASASPTTFSYALLLGTANGQTSTRLQTSGTSNAHPASIQTAAGSYKAARISPGQGTFGNSTDVANVAIHYVDMSRMGDTVNAAITFSPSTGGFLQTIDHTIFDTCGVTTWASGATATEGWSITNNTWRSTNAKTNVASSRVNPLLTSASIAPNGGVTRTVSGNVFDKTPSLSAACTGNCITGNLFAQAFDATSAVTTALVDGNLTLLPYYDPKASSAMNNNYIIFDTSPGVTADGSTHVAASATASTLTVSGTPWGLHAYQSASTGLALGHIVILTSGKGMHQVRAITDNTANTLTVVPDWTVTPDTTSNFEIRAATANPHGWGYSQVGTGVSFSLIGNVYEFHGGDNEGDAFKSFADTVPTLQQNIVLPSLSGDNSGTLVTLGGELAGYNRTFLRNTYFTGSQSLNLAEGPPVVSSFVLQYRNNVAWAVPGVTYRLVTGGGGRPGASSLGPHKLQDSQQTPCGGATINDQVLVTGGVSQSDHNTGWGLTAGCSDVAHVGGGIGYNTSSTVTMGLSDVDVNPMFVDTSRRFWTWARMNGSTGSVFQIIADGYAQLKKINDRSGYNPAYNIASLIAWVKQGYDVQNPLIWYAASDGGTIGAQPARTPVQAFFAPFVF